MRIISGKFRGRKLQKSDHLKSLRPTTDRNREALFNILSSAKFLREINFEIAQAKVLDICCGSGSVGLEAVSRGADFVTFIDKNREHLELVKKNCAAFGVENQIEILCLDAKKLPQNDKIFDLIFLDPPYDEDYSTMLLQLIEKNWIGQKTLLVVEAKSNKGNFLNLPQALRHLDSRRYGETVFGFFNAN